jgi:DNA-directed RNA polymerase subunit K/omega
MSSKKNNKIKSNTIESNDDIDDDKDINNFDDDYSDYDKSDNEDNNIIDDEDDEDFEPTILDYSLIEEDDDIVKEINKITRPFLTKYEMVKLLATRTNQLARGAKPMIKNVDYSITPKDLAKLELKEKVIPLIVLRPIPNGKPERWKITEFKNI